MRVIRFKGWDKDRKEIFNISEIIIYKNNVIGCGSTSYKGYCAPAERVSNILMQYINSNDINNKEIYRMDIVKNVYNNERYIVKYNYESSCFYPFNIYPSTDFEIIGNVYSNPKLYQKVKEERMQNFINQGLRRAQSDD